MRNLVSVVGLWALLASSAWAQPPFRYLRVAAFDKSGQPVTDLTAQDFKVTDDGKAVGGVSVMLDDIRPGAAAAPGANEYSNQTGLHPTTTVILFDMLNGTFTDRNFISSTIQRSIEGAENKESLHLYILTNKATLYPVRPLPKLRPEGPPVPPADWEQPKALIDAAIDHVFGLRPVDEKVEGNREAYSYRALHDLADAMGVLPGPKSLVWTTEGFPMPVNFGGYCHDVTLEGVKAPCLGDLVDFTPVVHRLAGIFDRAGISIWPVDEAQSASNVLARTMLDTFAGMTGGRGYSRGQTSAALTDASKAMHLHYTLTYEPEGNNWNGKFHRVKVTCERKNVQIVAEDGYDAVPPVDETGDLISAAARATHDVPEIALQAVVSAGAAAGTMRLQLKIGPAGLLMVPRDNHYTAQLALLLVGLGGQEPVQLSKASGLTVKLTAEQWEKAKSGITTAEEVKIPEKVNRVRVILVDQWGQRVGSLTIPKS